MYHLQYATINAKWESEKTMRWTIDWEKKKTKDRVEQYMKIRKKNHGMFDSGAFPAYALLYKSILYT